ncbi:MAG: hypothetical protein AB7R55_15025 [Gemmatimonadales bacterium]
MRCVASAIHWSGVVLGVALSSVAGPLGAQPAGTVIVTNMSDATATLVDAATGRVVGTLSTGVGPHEVAVSHDGRWAVVTNYGNRDALGSSLTVIDVARGAVDRTLDLSPHTRPHGVAFLPGDSVLAVTSETGKAVLLVHLPSGTVRRTVSTMQPVSHMLALAADGRRAFTSNVTAGTITALDLVSGAADTIRVARLVEGIGVRPDGNEVWVGSNAEGTVSVVDPAAGKVVATIGDFGMPYRIGFTPDGGTVVVSDPVKGVIRIFASGTREQLASLPIDREGIVATTEVEGSPAPEGVALSRDGRWAFVTLQGKNQVAFVDLGARRVTRTAPTGTWPDGIGFSPVVVAR